MDRYDELLGVLPYNPELDVDEWIVCSVSNHSGNRLGHSTHTDFRDAKLAQMKLFTDRGIDAWIEFIPALGPPGIEEQLDAARSST